MCKTKQHEHMTNCASNSYYLKLVQRHIVYFVNILSLQRKSTLVKEYLNVGVYINVNRAVDEVEIFPFSFRISLSLKDTKWSLHGNFLF